MKEDKFIRPRPGKLKEVESSDNICVDETLRPLYRPVDVRLRCEMTYCINIVVTEDFPHATGVTDVHLLKDVPVAKSFAYAFQVFRIPCIGQLVDINYSACEPRFLQHIMDEVTADKSAAACDHQIINIHVTPFLLILTLIYAGKRYVFPFHQIGLHTGIFFMQGRIF